MDRQTVRIRQEARRGARNNLLELTQQDLLGVTVVDLETCAAWKTLSAMIGLQSVKQNIRDLAELIKTNLALELAGQQMRHVALNRLFLGNPGTQYVRQSGVCDRCIKSMIER